MSQVKESLDKAPVTNAASNKGQVPRSKRFLITLTGLLVGLIIGVFSYLLTNRLFDSEDSGIGLSSAESPIVRSTPDYPTKELSRLDWIFTSELDLSDLQELSVSLSQLNQQDVQSLIEISSTQPLTVRLYTVQDMLFESLVRSAPEQAVSVASNFGGHRRQILIRNIFSQWSSINLESALAAISKLQKTDRTIALDTIIATRIDLPSAELSSIASRLNFETDLLEWQQDQSIQELTNGVPMNAIDLLVNDEVDDVKQLDLYFEIVEKWFQVDGLGILTELQQAILDDELFAELFDYITGKDRTASLNFLIDVEWSVKTRLGPRLINAWIDDNGEEAFDAVRTLPKSSFRSFMLERLIYKWSRKAPNVVLDRLMDIPRAVRADALSISTSKLALDSPTDALARISALESVLGANPDLATQSVIRTWSSEAPTLALDWIQANVEEGTSKRAELISQILSSYTLIDPEHAMTVAVEEFHPDNNTYSLERTVISSLLSHERIDTAIELIGQVRDEERGSISTNIGVYLVKRDQIDRAVELSDQVAEEERLAYFNMLGVNLLQRQQPAAKFLELIEKIPSTSLRSDVAEIFLKGLAKQRLNADQLETLKSYVSE